MRGGGERCPYGPSVPRGCSGSLGVAPLRFPGAMWRKSCLLLRDGGRRLVQRAPGGLPDSGAGPEHRFQFQLQRPARPYAPPTGEGLEARSVGAEGRPRGSALPGTLTQAGRARSCRDLAGKLGCPGVRKEAPGQAKDDPGASDPGWTRAAFGREHLGECHSVVPGDRCRSRRCAGDQLVGCKGLGSGNRTGVCCK